jgi:hypothetical protein
MKTTNEKVYRCDYCNKAMVSAGFMKLHERMCKKNPNNQHQCFKYCKWLDKSDAVGIKIDEDGHEWNDIGIIEFTCKKHDCNFFNKPLYSYKLERFKSKADRLKSMIRMPLKCDFYKTEKGHDFSDDNFEQYDINEVF